MSVPQIPTRWTRTTASPAWGDLGSSMSMRWNWPGFSRTMAFIVSLPVRRARGGDMIYWRGSEVYMATLTQPIPPWQKGSPPWVIATLFPAQGDWSEGEYLELSERTNRLIELADAAWRYWTCRQKNTSSSFSSF